MSSKLEETQKEVKILKNQNDQLKKELQNRDSELE